MSTTPKQFSGSPANAKLLTALGLDPMKITGDALDVEVYSADLVIIRYQGVHSTTADEYARALLSVIPDPAEEDQDG